MPQVTTYTTAPEALDAFDTKTKAILGTYLNGEGPRIYRQVITTEEHVKTQCCRYGKAKYNAHTEAEWQELQTQEWFMKKFTPTQEDITMEKKCSNCKKVANKLATGRCDPCYRWFKKHGVERRVNIGLAPIVEPEAQEPLEAQVEPMTQESKEEDIIPQVLSPLEAKVTILMALVAQGAEAMAEAIKHGRITVRMPSRKHSKTSGHRASVDMALSEAIIQSRAEGMSYRAIEDKYGIGTGNGTKAWTICKHASVQ